MHRKLEWPKNLLWEIYRGFAGIDRKELVRYFDEDAFIECVDALEEKCREAVINVYRDGMTHTESAGRMDLTKNVHLRCMHKAYAELRYNKERYADPLLLEIEALRHENEILREDLGKAARIHADAIDHLAGMMLRANDRDPVSVLKLPDEMYARLIRNRINIIRQLEDLDGISWLTDKEKELISRKLTAYANERHRQWRSIFESRERG